jgi:hypothetical protein
MHSIPEYVRYGSKQEHYRTGAAGAGPGPFKPPRPPRGAMPPRAGAPRPPPMSGRPPPMSGRPPPMSLRNPPLPPRSGMLSPRPPPPARQQSLLYPEGCTWSCENYTACNYDQQISYHAQKPRTHHGRAFPPHRHRAPLLDPVGTVKSHHYLLQNSKIKCSGLTAHYVAPDYLPCYPPLPSSP